MIERMGFEPSEALEGTTKPFIPFVSAHQTILAFNRARGHSMEKYTEDLLRREPFSYENLLHGN